MTIFEFFFQPPQKEYLNAFSNRPLWLNWLLWNIRNPLPGISILLRTDPMPGVSDWNTNFGWLFLRHKSGLPFVSYRARAEAYKMINGKTVPLPVIDYQSISHGDPYAKIKRFFPYFEFHFGWNPSGSFGAAIRLTCSKGY